MILVFATVEGPRRSLPPRVIRTGRVGGGVGDALVEALSTFDRSGLQVGGSGWPAVVGGDAVGGAPDGDFTDEAGAQRSTLRCPCGLGRVAEGVVADVTCEGSNQLGSLGQVASPGGMSADGTGDSG